MNPNPRRMSEILTQKLAVAHEEAAHWQATYEDAAASLDQVVAVLTDAQKRKLGIDA